LLLGVSLVSVGILIVAVIARPFPRMWSGPQDFTGFYLGAKHIGGPLLYDLPSLPAERAAATGIADPEVSCRYIRLPFYAAILRPLSRLTHDHALILWKVLTLLGLAAAVFLLDPSRKVALLAITSSVGAAETVKMGQDTWIVLLLICGFFRLLARDRQVAAGVLLGLAIALKPHLFVPLAAATLVGRCWKLLGGVAISGSAALALCFAAQGLHWPVDWLAICSTDMSDSVIQGMPTIPGVFCLRVGSHLPFYLLAEAFTTAVAALAAKRFPFATAAAVAILAGIIGSAHSYRYDLLLAIPPCLAIARREDSAVPLILLTPLAQLLIGIGVPVFGPALAVAATLAAIAVPFARRIRQGRVLRMAAAFPLTAAIPPDHRRHSA